MRNVLLAGLLGLTACTTVNRIQEPERSEYFVSCMLNGHLHASTCECMEERAVKKTGITSIAKLDEDKQKEFVKALLDESKDCQEQTKAQLQETINQNYKPSESSGSGDARFHKL